MLTEKEIYGCNALSKKTYWRCDHCIYEEQKSCKISFKSKVKAIGEHLLEIKENKIFVKIKDQYGYTGFETTYNLQKICDILQKNKDKPYDFILSLFK